VGTIRGGAAVNVVPDKCVLEIGLRLLPGMASEAVEDRVARVVDSALPGETYEISPAEVSPPLEAASSGRLVRAVTGLTGRPPASVAYATDAGWLQAWGMECVVFGPGSIEVAHRPNESIGLDDLRAGRTALEAIICEFCVAPS
jgi:acetylornithine deacetylase